MISNKQTAKQSVSERSQTLSLRKKARPSLREISLSNQQGNAGSPLSLFLPILGASLPRNGVGGRDRRWLGSRCHLAFSRW